MKLGCVRLQVEGMKLQIIAKQSFTSCHWNPFIFQRLWVSYNLYTMTIHQLLPITFTQQNLSCVRIVHKKKYDQQGMGEHECHINRNV